MADPACHYCTRPAEMECPTCGRLYCPLHGEDVCLRCMAPESATPSSAVYRGSVLALILGTLVVVFLMVRPPESKGSADTVHELPTPTTSIGATATPTAPAAATRATPGGAATPTPSASASATATTAAPATYTIREGDTLSGIAAQFNTTVDALIALNPGISADNLPVGQEIKLPPAQ
ncbi:MAG: LysM peptidoglycan-binding domain-containing protein [Hyphomicrobiales bacterium]